MSRIIAISTSSFGKVSSEPLEALAGRGLEIRMNPHGRTLRGPEIGEHLAGVCGLIAGTEPLTADILRAAAPLLKVVSRVGVGIDNVDLEAARELGIAVHSTPAAHVDAVAELTLAGILSCLRRTVPADRSVRDGRWQKPMGSLLRGKVVGIVGLGRVGRALCHLLEPFATRRIAYDPFPDREWASANRIEYCEMADLLRQSDVVSLHLPYSPAARHLIGQDELAKLKPGALLVNTARGGLVDEDALVRHLSTHPDARAYIDCFEHEPYSGPLANLENAVLTPHIGSYARECRARMETEAVANLLSTLDNE